MIFNSFNYVLFFIIVFALYYISPHKLRWIILLISSCIFYMFWRAELIVLILFTSFVNFYISKRIYRSQIQKNKKQWLILSLFINFGFLFIFKYMVFVNHSFMALYNLLGWSYPIKDFDIILPMGISFYTFQAASYTIDIYRGSYRPVKNYFKFTLYITFFPQLVAGPIERADRLLVQFFTKKKFNLNTFTEGFDLILIGYFKKIVIADRAATLVNAVYNNVGDYSGLAYIFATVIFAFQIYCDFSGYSDIARGSAKCFGIDLMVNFDRPYISASIKEFWRRWHISLSSWFKDYVYIPLGGNRVSTPRKYLNIFITFMVSGLWHGANWTFVIWGALHGIYQIIGDIKNRILSAIKLDKLRFKPFSIIITFILVCFAWIFFRANNIGDAIFIIKNLFADITKITDLQYLYEVVNSLGLQMFEIMLLCGCILLLILNELLEFKAPIYESLKKVPYIFRFSYYYILAIIILALGVFSSGGEFIYFQF